MKKLSQDEIAAEKYFDRWWDVKDRWNATFQEAIPEAYLDGIRAERRRCINVIKKLDEKGVVMPSYGEAIAAIRGKR